MSEIFGYDTHTFPAYGLVEVVHPWLSQESGDMFDLPRFVAALVCVARGAEDLDVGIGVVGAQGPWYDVVDLRIPVQEFLA